MPHPTYFGHINRLLVVNFGRGEVPLDHLLPLRVVPGVVEVLAGREKVANWSPAYGETEK